MTYEVYVVYYYQTSDGRIGLASDRVRCDFMPNTADGIVELIDGIKEDTEYEHIVILNMIPLAIKRKPYEYDEDDVE